MQRAKPVTVDRFYREHGERLGLKLVAGAAGLDRLIREPTVNRPGLMLAGFRRYFAERRMQVLGSAETHYLRSMPPATRAQRYGELFSTRIPCVVFCRGNAPDADFRRRAEAARVPVLRCPQITMKFINQATLALEEMFAPSERVHGSMVDILGIGVLIMGEPGIGKSECAVGLIERGYSLVADDTTEVHLHSGRELIGTCPRLGRNFMEVRGIGFVDVPAMFGIKGIRTEKRVDLVVTLKRWDPQTGHEIERVGDQLETMKILGVDIPHMTIPVCPGRDVARLVEVASFHMKLRILGYNPAEALNRVLVETMQQQKPGTPPS
jgi:HPr kinase/phosphorylase